MTVEMDIRAGAERSRPIAMQGRAVPLSFAIALSAWTLTNMDQSMFGYAVPDILKAFGVTIDQIGILISATFVAGIFGASLGGIATDIWGVRRTLPVCLGLSALMVGLQSFATSAAVFALLRIGSFMFSAALSPICNALVANLYGHDRRPMMVSILQCGYPLGWFIASFAAVPLIETHGWRAPFLVAFAVIPLSLLFQWGLPRSECVENLPSTRSKPSHRPVAILMSDHRRKALLCTLIFFLYGGAVIGAVFYLPTFFQQVRGYDAATAARIVGLSFGVSMIGYIGSAVVSQTLLSRRTTAMLWAVLGGGLFLAMTWLPHSALQDAVLFSIAAIFFFGTASITTVYLLEIFPPEIRATAAGISASGGLSAGSVLFPLLVADASLRLGWQMTFSLVIVPPLFLCALLLFALPHDG